MYARMLEGTLKLEKKPEFTKKMHEEIIPILRKQTGFADIIGLEHDAKPDKFCLLTLWHNKTDAERYEREIFPKMNEIMKPYMVMPVVVNIFKVDTTISEHVLAAVAA